MYYPPRLACFQQCYMTVDASQAALRKVRQATIDYRDGSGVDTHRTISAWTTSGESQITAHCHLRDAERPFNLPQMLHVVDDQTGEIVANPWDYFELPASLARATGGLRSALCALKYFSAAIRGLGKPQRVLVVGFMRQQLDLPETDEDLERFFYEHLWCDLHSYTRGDLADYQRHLSAIPEGQLKACRDVAVRIAAGSGRKPIDPTALHHIESAFVARRAVPVSD